MKLQKASYCALYAVLELARDPEVQLSATDIAEKYGISANHLAKVLRDLGRAGLVESVRGAGGGYRFSGNMKRTTLFDVIQLFEDVGGESQRTRDHSDETDVGASLDLVMREIDEIACATLGSITIETLLKTMNWRKEREEREKAANKALG